MDDQGLWERSVLPDDRARAREADLRHYLSGEPLDIEVRVLTRSGDVRWIRDQAVILLNERGQPTRSQGIMLDITEQKKAEQALNDAEERYRSLIETLPAVTYIDPIDDPLTTIYVSPQIETIFGFTAEEWCRSDAIWREHLHADDRDATEAAMLHHDETGEPLDVVYRFQHRTGQWLWVRDQAIVITDDEGRPRFSQGVMLDITATKTAEDRLREAEERYRGIVEHVPAAIYLDRTDGSTESIYVSPQIEEIVGVTPEQWMADPDLWLRLMHPEDRPSVQRSYAEATVAIEPWSAEYRLQTPDGRTIWVHDEITFLHDEGGAPQFMQGVIFDVTERKLAEQALRESEQRERDAAERLRALDEMKNTFLAAVSHELRSPLTSILGLSLTLERAPDMRTDDRGDLLRRLATNARKLDQLLKDLLDIDRLNRGIVEPQYRVTDVGALARRTIESLDALAGRDVVAETDSVTIAVDPAKVERVVENLLMNAARHTAGDRRIWLRVSSLEGGVLIKVEDDGPGVPAELRDVIFEPFRQGPTASPHAPGTGIGLSLVARFAELHGGRAWVGEREGGGASFRVFIPGHPDLVGAAPTRSTEPAALPHATAESA
jgi:PAS domain S-box-containing protein